MRPLPTEVIKVDEHTTIYKTPTNVVQTFGITEKQLDMILDKYEKTGTPIKIICGEMSINAYVAWSMIKYRKDKYDRFKQIRAMLDDFKADALAEETIKIADEDKTEQATLRVKSRQWMASKLDKERYGDKLSIESKNLDVQVVYPIKGAEQNAAEPKD